MVVIHGLIHGGTGKNHERIASTSINTGKGGVIPNLAMLQGVRFGNDVENQITRHGALSDEQSLYIFRYILPSPPEVMSCAHARIQDTITHQP